MNIEYFHAAVVNIRGETCLFFEKSKWQTFLHQGKIGNISLVLCKSCAWGKHEPCYKQPPLGTCSGKGETFQQGGMYWNSRLSSFHTLTFTPMFCISKCSGGAVLIMLNYSGRPDPVCHIWKLHWLDCWWLFMRLQFSAPQTQLYVLGWLIFDVIDAPGINKWETVAMTNSAAL